MGVSLRVLVTLATLTTTQAKHHIYCTRNGRFSMAGVTPSNVGRIADAMKDVIASA